MKVCYFGPYDKNYPRNRVIRNGLKANGVAVIECCDRERLIFKRYLGLFLKYLKCDKDYDVMIVAEFGATNVLLARILTSIRGKLLIFDPFISFYDSNVFDRRLVKEGSFYAKYLHFLDRFSCSLADFVLVHTNKEKDYFQKEFAIHEEKLKIIRLGVDNSLFYPREVNRKDNNFLVLYFGSYAPCVGLEQVLEAAKLLKGHAQIKFKLIGQIPDAISKELRGLANVSFSDWVAQDETPILIAQADVCLGTFGDTQKAKRVIPNRVLEVLAMKKPLITGNYPGINEILKHEEHAFLCRHADPKALAEAILFLHNDRNLARKIAEAGYKLYLDNFTPEVIGREVKKLLEEIIKQGKSH